MKVNIGDIVFNEYNHVGKLNKIHPWGEAEVDVINYGEEHDTDYCNISNLRKATDEEIGDALLDSIKNTINNKE